MHRSLERQDWSLFFDGASRKLDPKAHQVEIEIAGDDVGDQEAVRALGLQGLTYDAKADEFEVVAEGIDHLISHPREIFVDLEGGGLRTVTVIDGEGNKQFIRVTPPIVQ